MRAQPVFRLLGNGRQKAHFSSPGELAQVAQVALDSTLGLRGVKGTAHGPTTAEELDFLNPVLRAPRPELARKVFAVAEWHRLLEGDRRQKPYGQDAESVNDFRARCPQTALDPDERRPTFSTTFPGRAENLPPYRRGPVGLLPMRPANIRSSRRRPLRPPHPHSATDSGKDESSRGRPSPEMILERKATLRTR